MAYTIVSLYNTIYLFIHSFRMYPNGSIQTVYQYNNIRLERL